MEYKEMYLMLFRAVTAAIEQLRARNYGRAEELLILAQQRAEEQYISVGEKP